MTQYRHAILGAMLGSTILAAAAASTPAWAQSARERLRECLFIEDDRERLICLEIEALRIVNGRANLDSDRASAPPPAARTKDDRSRRYETGSPPPPRLAPREAFGLSAREPDMPDAIDVMIIEMREREPGTWALITEDGQIWETTESRPIDLNADTPISARIEKGFLGSYFLEIEGTPGDIRVKRKK